MPLKRQAFSILSILLIVVLIPFHLGCDNSKEKQEKAVLDNSAKTGSKSGATEPKGDKH